ncbi:hypothetical protein PYW07_007909 [Mythimna separata]|uniref:C2H2-type domain-containing protein n=1 Tax=Mythimna separata TaxID=271217 RepID=A0AAD7YRT8_MYTSE|nr:hypothetical protein PYW07_007909 [Mythimna separata]
MYDVLQDDDLPSEDSPDNAEKEADYCYCRKFVADAQMIGEKTTLTCGQCSMQYCNYKHLLEHLYWRHDIESIWCKQCSLKRWQYAVHECNVLPIYEVLQDDDLPSEDSPDSANAEKEADYFYCRKFVADG